MHLIEVTFAPLEEACRTIDRRPHDWVDHLPQSRVEFTSLKAAQDWMPSQASQALHGHFVVREIERTDIDEELDRQVFEF